MRSSRLVGVFMSLALAIGCADRGPPAEAEGAVTYDGQPVTSGIISFLPAEPNGRPSGGGAVLDGRYRLYPDSGLKPGKYRVEIHWARPTGEKKKDVGYGESPDVVAEALPDKYHTQSILTADLKPGPNAIDFILEK